MSLEFEAKTYFEEHYNCAQSVFAPFANRFGLDEDLAMRIATPFGGGMGHAGQVCGAVSGALLAVGLVEGISTYDKEAKDACYALAREFQARFRDLHGDVTCPGLLGLDIGVPAELAKVRELDLFHTRCPNYVGDAARLVGEMLGVED